MKINEKREVVALEEIAFGEAFEYGGDLFIKCLTEEQDVLMRTIANIETGRILKMNYKELVRPLDAEIVINQ